MPPDNQNEQAGYDYDSIMRKLRSNEDSVETSTSEVVIDEKTGEKKVRVRKRRRSSESSSSSKKSSEAAFNHLLNLAWIALACLIIILLGFWFLRTSRFQSASFSGAFSEQMTQRVPGKVASSNWDSRFTRLRVNRISYQGTESEVVAAAEIRGLEGSAGVFGLMGGGDLEMGYLQAQVADMVVRKPQGEVVEGEVDFSSAWESPVPTGLTAEGIQFNRFNLIVPQVVELGMEEEKIHGIDGGLLRVSFADRSFELFDGEFKLKPWTPIFIRSAKGRISEDGSWLILDDVEGEMGTLQKEGEVRFQGKLPWRGEGPMELKFIGKRVSPKALLGEDSLFRDRFEGSFDLSEGEFLLPATEGAAPELSFVVNSDTLKAREMDFFESLASILVTEELRRPVMDSCTARVSLKDGVWHITELEMVTRGGQVKISGELTWSAEDSLKGEVQVEITQAMMSLVWRDNAAVMDSGFRPNEQGVAIANFSVFGDKVEMGKSAAASPRGRFPSDDLRGSGEESKPLQVDPQVDDALKQYDDLMRDLGIQAPQEEGVEGAEGADIDTPTILRRGDELIRQAAEYGRDSATENSTLNE